MTHTAENDAPRRHLTGCILAPEHGAGCVRQQWAASDPGAPWNRDQTEIGAPQVCTDRHGSGPCADLRCACLADHRTPHHDALGRVIPPESGAHD